MLSSVLLLKVELTGQLILNWLRGVQEVIPPDVMLPEGRLETLLEQALTQQLNTVDNNRAPVQMPVSLLTDYSFSRSHIPTLTTQVLPRIPSIIKP